MEGSLEDIQAFNLAQLVNGRKILMHLYSHFRTRKFFNTSIHKHLMDLSLAVLIESFILGQETIFLLATTVIIATRVIVILEKVIKSQKV